MTTHIVTMGGGGFSTSPTGAATKLDKYVVDLAGKPNPVVCFLPTASADDPRYINRFLTAYGALGIRPIVATLWHDAARSVSRLEEADVIVVGGGLTVNLIALWNAHGVSTKVRKIIDSDRDVVIAGYAAGGGAFYEGCTTDSFGPIMAWRGGLGALPGSFCSHYHSEGERAPIFAEAIGEGTLPSGYGVDDGAAIHWVGGKPKAFLAEDTEAKVYRVEGTEEPTSSGVYINAERMRVL
ncbi:Type 1 glutamine amidotransferase-like domain-containing protein [Raineyella sp. LH-20]|uniref:Type 1 glutamine amidotransferase-like domain-containing protein n=1 Tax=Raineyella sp. LH-20 TaxID=3081204 RepID=UPI002953425A|nr:Type 1 glutamine amidotransferase-like domain-containing protein [Raineyella sp. LH-20]WOP17851.1 Type 1 glutamine amidotransferase-like domain-containing protein [Raineyella sp. LH-20]